tara:strand:+ start:23766 stop:24851 length:1086 start_codon:yes stop_codon:yes gene_type:complete
MRYQYSIEDTLNNRVDLSKLEAEILSSNEITISLSQEGISLENGQIHINFKAELSIQEQFNLNALVSAHDGTPAKLPTQEILISTYPPRVGQFTIVSHRWNDKTTWYQESTLVEGEEPTPNQERTIWSLDNSFIIDVTHGKIHGEDWVVCPETGLSYSPRVYVDGELKVERSADFENFGDEPGDYQIDYEYGEIEFHEPIPEGSHVLVDYHFANSSLFTIKPSSGSKLDLSKVEVQFSKDSAISDTVTMALMGYANVFAPDRVSSGELQPEDLVMVGQPSQYKTFYDFCNEANGAYPEMPNTTNPSKSWRDSNNGVLTFPWDYKSVMPIDSAHGMELRVYLKKDRPFGGEFATATFYGFKM